MGSKSAYAWSIGYGEHGFEALEVFVGTCTVAASCGSVLMAITKRRVWD